MISKKETNKSRWRVKYLIRKGIFISFLYNFSFVKYTSQRGAANERSAIYVLFAAPYHDTHKISRDIVAKKLTKIFMNDNSLLS